MLIKDKLASRPKFVLGLEELSSASASSTCPRRVLELFTLPHENDCNDGTGNHGECAMIIYQS